MKVIIVGAGVAGLAIGWRLAQAGAVVEIFERGVAGRGATWAAAGMLAAGAEIAGGHDVLGGFARHARSAWADFASELNDESGIDVGFKVVGSLLVAHDEARATELQTLASEQLQLEWLDQLKLKKREPLLSSKLLGALSIANDAYVENRSLGDALKSAVSKHGGLVRENCAVRSLLIEQDRLRGVVTSFGTCTCDAIVLACGAWVNLLNGDAPLPPVRPAKGQMIAMEPRAAIAMPQRLIWDDEVYLAPRTDKLFVGATVEDVGFDTSITREACAKLVTGATRLIPELAHWRVSEMWAGLRPRTPDDAPVLGKTSIEGLYVAGGQFRNGILFAPAVADAMSAMALNKPGVLDISAFDPRRFAQD